MTKLELIDRIREMNRSAGAEFLAEFSEAELQQYLANLTDVWADFKSQFAGSGTDGDVEPAKVKSGQGLAAAVT